MGKDAEIPLAQDVKKDPAGASRSLRKIAMVINSLIRRGFLKRTGVSDFEIVGAGGNGTVTSLANGTGLVFSPSPITGNGTLSIGNTGVTAGNFTFASVTFNAQGQATAAANGSAVPTSRTLTAGTGLTGGGDLSADRSFALANTAVSAGNYTYMDATVDAQGRLTAASNGPVPANKGEIFSFSNAPAMFSANGVTDGWVITRKANAAFGFDWEAQAGGNGAGAINITDGANTVANATSITFTGGATVSGTTPNASVAIPSGGNGTGNDPISSVYPVFTLGTSDDEFANGSFTGWTAVNSGSHTVVVTQTNNVASLAHPGGDGGAEMHAWAKTPTITTGSYVEIAFRSIGFNQNFNDCGVFFADGTTYGSGIQATFWDSMSDKVWALGAWTNYNSQGSTGAQAYDQSTPHSDVFLRLVYNGSNSFTGWVSCDGISWMNTGITRTITLTPTKAGFWVSTGGGANPCLFSIRYVKFG